MFQSLGNVSQQDQLLLLLGLGLLALFLYRAGYLRLPTAPTAAPVRVPVRPLPPAPQTATTQAIADNLKVAHGSLDEREKQLQAELQAVQTARQACKPP